MHTFAQNQNQPGKPRSAGFARAGRQTEQQVSEPARLRITSLEPRGLGHAAAPPIVHEQAQTSPGIFETNPLFLENQSPGATWNFSKVPVYPLGLRNGVERSSPAPTSRLPGPIQRKLKVGAIDDPLEHEADRVANQVMRMPASDAAITSTPPQVSRKCDRCKEEEKLQKKEAAPQPAVGNAPASVHKTLNSPGQPLDSETRAFFEPRFGSDFSRVRIHADSPAAESADSVQARAYTVGHHVAFARDQFAPGTANGRHLLAHELAHVVQQASADAPLVQRGPPGAGGQSGQKFFDPSRGPMTDAEKAKLLALRRSLHLPDTPTESDTSIVGILVTETGEEIPFNSSERGGYFGGVRPGDVKGGPGSSTNRYNRTHVETWAANAMRQRGLKRAVLLIELEPCAVCGGYQRGQPTVDTKVPSVSGQLPEDAQLIVVDGQSASYFRQTPTDPQRPARVTPKPPDDPSGSKDEPGGAGTGKSPKSGGEGGTEVEPGSAGKTGGTTPAPKTTGEQPPAPKTPPKAPSGEPPQVKATGGVKAPAGTDVEPGGGGTAPGKGGVKAPGGTDVEHGGTSPTQKTPGTSSAGHGGMAIEVGATAATMGLEWLAAYLKRKVDERMANQQIAAFKAIAKKSINANPDKAVKLMLGDPYRTIYAWIHLDSSVISTLGLDPWGQPTLSDSAPLFDLSGIEYQPMPMDPALVDLLPKFSTGATHITVTRPMVIDLPLTTPSFEELISYAKAHNLPLDDANAYAFTRLQAASTTLHNILESNQKILGSKQELNEVIKQSQAQLKIAKKLRNAELQKTIENNIASATEKMNSIKGVDPETIQKSSREVAYWEHLNDITKPSMPKP